MFNKRWNMNKSQASLGKKIYAIVMSVMMVLSLWPSGATLALADGGSTISPGKYGNITYSTNDTKDAFSDAYYNKYHDSIASKLLGDAGNFHITGFSQVNINSHVAGNVLTKKLTGDKNFGLRDAYKDNYGYTGLSYVQDFNDYKNGRVSEQTDGLFVVGSMSKVTQANGSEIYINGVKFESPSLLMQDEDSDNTPFIDIDAAKQKAVSVSNELAQIADVGCSKSTEGFKTYINYEGVEGVEGCAFITMTAEELNKQNGEFYISGMNIDEMDDKSISSVVINVDMQGEKELNLQNINVVLANGQNAAAGEYDSTVGYVMFNIMNSTADMTINASRNVVLASILAPNATINLKCTAAGTYIADYVNVEAESHARPFRGTLKPVETGVTVNKRWLDAYGNAESSDVVSTHGPVRVQLYQKKNGGDFVAYGDPVELSNSNNWSYTWEGLTKKDTDQNTYEYKVAEVSATDDYTTGEPTQNNTDGTSWTITNRHVAVGKISVNKVWADDDNYDQIRPDSVTVKIVRSVEGGQAEDYKTGIVLNEENNWSYSEDYLPLKDANGNVYTYSVVEDKVEGYETSIPDVSPTYDEDGNATWTYTVTNTHKSISQKTSVSVDKTWLTAAGVTETGDHPAVKVQLYQSKNGGDPVAYGNEVELSSDNSWSYTWKDLVSVDGHGNKYAYTVKEVGVTPGYSSSVSNDGDSWHITNKRKATAQVSIEKKWQGAADSDIPDEVTFSLYRSVNGGRDEFVQDVTVKKSEDWKAAVSDLDAVNANGEAYNYKFAEKTVEGFSSTITNPEPTTDATTGNVTWSFTAINTKTEESTYTNVQVTKKWHNAAGETSQPGASEVKVQLYRSANGGTAQAYGEVVTLSDANNWQASWNKLVKYDATTKISYSYEVKEAEVEGYVATSSVAFNEQTNTYEVAITNTAKATVSVKVNKTWDDAQDADGLRPQTVKVDVIQATADGSESKTVKTLELNEGNSWSATVAGLAKADANGNDYVYTIKESEVAEGYTATYFDPVKTTDSDGNSVWTFSLKNTHEQAKTSVAVTKNWDDTNNQDGIRAKSVTVNVVRTLDGADEKETVETVTLSADNGWTATVTGLAANKDGKPYTYSVEEANTPEGYTADVKQVDGEKGTWTFTLTNKHEVATTSIYVKKVWDDADNADQIRPTEVKIQLCVKNSDGSLTAVEGYDTLTLNAANNWGADGTYGWGNLPVYNAGEKINYTVAELDVEDGYTAQVSDGLSTDDGKSYTFTVTNTHAVEEMDFSLTGYSVASITETLDADETCYVDPKIYKKLVGRQLKAGEFKFQLVDENSGAVISQTTNDEAGMVDFDAAANVSPEGMEATCLKFTAPGTYTYVVREVSETKDATVNYSEEVVKFVVEVSRDASSGKLVTDGGHYYCYKNAAATMGDEVDVYDADDHPTITNSVKGVILGLTKVDENGAALAGATYGLYTTGADNAEVLVATATSDANGQMTFGLVDDNVIAEDTEYWFREIAAPEGYQLSYEETEHFKVSHDKTGFYLVDLDGNKLGDTVAPGVAVPFTHSVVDTALSATFIKLDSNRDAVKGAKLAVYESGKTTAIDEWVSDGTGHKVSGLLANKTYVLREVEAPSGYRKAVDVEFKLSAGGNITLVSGGKNTINGESAINAFTSGGSLSLIDYRIDEREETREEKRTVYKKDGKEISREEYEEIVIKRKGSKNSAVPYTGDNTKQGTALLTCAGILLLAGCAFWMHSRRQN